MAAPVAQGRRGLPSRAIVLLAGVWESFDRSIDGRVLRVGTPALRGHLVGRLATATTIASAADARLVLLTTPCFSPSPDGPIGDLRVLGESRRIDWFNRIIRGFAAEHPSEVSVIDLHEIACPHGEYRDVVDGVEQRIDGVHFTRDAATQIWQRLGPDLVDAAELGSGAVAAGARETGPASRPTIPR